MARTVAYTDTDAPEEWQEKIDSALADNKLVRFSLKTGRSVVILSSDEYDGIEETLHLLRSPANISHLQKSLAQLKAGETALKAVGASGRGSGEKKA